MKPLPAVLLLSTLVAALGDLPARSQEFPPITAEERALTAVPGAPNAPALVLFRKGELLMQGYGFVGSYKSHMRVQARVKILTVSGQSRGEISIVHSERTRLAGFSGRTVLPDGTVVPVPPNAQFQRRASQSKGIFVTTVAFPSVQVGAILDYQYELVSAFPPFLEPWYLSDGELPVRRAEVVYEIARNWRTKLYSRAPLGAVIHTEETDSFKGHVLRVWAENLPSLPREPQSPPFGELAAQVLVLPAEAPDPDHRIILLSSWQSTSALYLDLYKLVSHRNLGVSRQAQALAPAGTPRQKAEALYRFVRDEVRTETSDDLAVNVEPTASVGSVLSKRRGTGIEKALLLGALLEKLDLRAVLVWARDRALGVVTDPQAANPAWFDAVFVALTLDGQRIFLDPAEPDLEFGQLPMGYEGTQALIPGSSPQGVTLPAVPFDQNLRRAEVELSLDAGGRLSGSGTLLLTGGPAWEKTNGKAETAEIWTQWLAERFRDFKIGGVKALETPVERKVTVTWTLAQREEEVLGDEVSLTPSAPLGPLAQPFVQTSADRRTSVLFDYPYREEVVLHLRWPEGWKVAEKPVPAAIDFPAGSLRSEETNDEGERLLVVHRRLDIVRREIETSQYEALRSLFSTVERNDQQKILLVRRP